MHKVYRSTVRSTLLLCSTVLLFSGCGTTNPLPDTKMRIGRIQDYQQETRQLREQEPINGPLTLSEAIARAIKYNLDDRVKKLEVAVARRHLNVARLGYLPELSAMAGYSSRNNEPGAVSRSIATGEVSLEPSSSQEKQHTLSTLRASWDMIDVGLTYFTVKQETNRIAIAKEQRRKVIQNIIQDVQDAYWRTCIARQLDAQIAEILKESDQTMQRYKDLTDQGRIDPAKGLAQQREVLQIRHSVRALQEQLALGPIHLSALLNLPPGMALKLAPVEMTTMPALPAETGKLEQMALNNRPELRMEDSRKKISVADARKALLEMFPHIEVYGQWNHDSNDYLYNNSWAEVGTRVTWNLLETANSTGRMMSYKTEQELADARQTALSLAIVSQVQLAVNRYGVAVAKYEDAADMQRVNKKLADLVSRDRLREGKAGFSRVRTNLQATAAEMEGMLAWVEVQNALMRLYNTIGIDPLSSIDSSMSVAEIGRRVDEYLRSSEQQVQQR